MKQASDIERLINHDKGLSIHTLMVSASTLEEQQRLQQLLLAALSDVEQKINNEAGVADDLPDFNDGEADYIPAPAVQAPPRPARRVPTVAADITKLATPAVVPTKLTINQKCNRLGGQRTPLRALSVTSDSRFSMSPGGTTGTFERQVTVVVKKASGGAFVDSPIVEQESPR